MMRLGSFYDVRPSQRLAESIFIFLAACVAMRLKLILEVRVYAMREQPFPNRKPFERFGIRQEKRGSVVKLAPTIRYEIAPS